MRPRLRVQSKPSVAEFVPKALVANAPVLEDVLGTVAETVKMAASNSVCP